MNEQHKVEGTDDGLAKQTKRQDEGRGPGPGMATVLMASAARKGDVPRMRELIGEGANPNCWDRGPNGKNWRPLVSTVAEKGHMSAARLLIERITDEMVGRDKLGDWRRDYEMSPLKDFAFAGIQDMASAMLAHCRDSMTIEQWEDLLFNCVRGDTTGLICECVGRLDQAGLESVEIKLILATGMLPPAWATVKAAMSQQGLDNQTPAVAPRMGPANRI